MVAHHEPFSLHLVAPLSQGLSSETGVTSIAAGLRCTALGADGQYYNVNADQMAASCAIACQADALIFLTDVPGVKQADGSWNLVGKYRSDA